MDVSPRAADSSLSRAPHGPLSASIRRVFLFALTASLLPLSPVFAQQIPELRVTRADTRITSHSRGKGDVVMMAPEGTVLQMIGVDGDRYAHRDTNWYWVMLPRDPWGTRHPGWVSGRDVEQVPQVAATPAPAAPIISLAETPEPAVPETAAAAEVETPAAPVAAPEAPMAPAVSEMILNFEFGKSDLTEAARIKLTDAVALWKAANQSVSFAIEGHADWIGSEPFNEKLGLARAETVKRYLAEEHQIPVDTISVVSHGELQPAASNDTQEGRAQNRRVVIKVGS